MLILSRRKDEVARISGLIRIQVQIAKRRVIHESRKACETFNEALGPPIGALYEICARRKGIAACIAVLVIGRKHQSAGADRDFAVTLDLCVDDEPSRSRERAGRSHLPERCMRCTY